MNYMNAFYLGIAVCQVRLLGAEQHHIDTVCRSNEISTAQDMIEQYTDEITMEVIGITNDPDHVIIRLSRDNTVST